MVIISTNFFVRNFITVSFCFSSFSKDTILSFKRSTTQWSLNTATRKQKRLFYVAVGNYCYLHTMQSTFHRISKFLKTFYILNKLSRFSSFCVLSNVVFVSSMIKFPISEKFVSSSFIICVCGAKILSGREGIKHGLVPIPRSSP